MVNHSQQPDEDELLQLIKNDPMSPAEHINMLVQRGWITRNGQVTVLLGGDVQPEKDAVPVEPPLKGIANAMGTTQNELVAAMFPDGIEAYLKKMGFPLIRNQ